MKTATMQPHQGRNVKRLREMLGIKQDALAIDLDMSQQAISMMEQKEELDHKLLRRIAEVMRVPVEAIENMTEDAVFNIINSTFTDTAIGNSNNNDCAFNFNPLDKLMEALDENKKLYERMLESEREKVEMLKALLNQK